MFPSTHSDSKPGLCGNLKQNIAVLQSKLSIEAKVSIRIALDGRPAADNARMVGIYREFGNIDLYAAKGMFNALHPPTLMRLETDADLVWPKPGNLKIGFRMQTALYCTRDDHEAAEESWAAPGNGELETATQVGFGGKRPMVMWNMEPTEDKDSYYGFFPVCKGRTSKTRSYE